MEAPTAGPTCLITGGLSGVGAATALAMAGLPARVVLCDLDDQKDPRLLEQIRAAGGEAITTKADVRDPQSIGRAAELAVATFGGIDVVVACAGISDQSAIATGDTDRWQQVVQTNLLGTIYTAHAALPSMLDRQRGHIFIISSVSGRETYVGEPVYIASKWGQIGFAHALRQEVMHSGIRVTVVEPGLIDTPLTRNNPAVRHLLDAAQPLDPSDVAAAILSAYQQREHVVVSEITIRPLRQELPSL